MDLVIPFSQACKSDIALAGGKGANLGELVRAGIPVPPGFILTTQAYSRFLRHNRLRPQIQALLEGLDPGDSARLNEPSARIKALITTAPMPPDTEDALLGAYRPLGDLPVAVRSSATAEDTAAASFAGQQSTYLNIEGEEPLLAAVSQCWASLYEPRAIVYRAQAGFAEAGVTIAVVVQAMVQAERSGVIFTVDPVSGDSGKMIVEAVFGLGEAVVSGMITPDMYLLRKQPLAIEQKEIAAQERAFTRCLHAGAADPNEWVEVPPARGRQQKLTDGEILSLAGLALEIEAHYGCPQDIEWAEEAGRFYIVQARPVTAGFAG